MQANLKERSVSKKVMGVTGCNFQLETKTCLCSSWVNICPKNRQIVPWLQLSGVWPMSALCVPTPQHCVLLPAPWHRHFACKELSRAFYRSSGATGASNQSKLVAEQEEMFRWAEWPSYKSKSCQSWQWKKEKKEWGIMLREATERERPHCKGHLFDSLAFFNGHHTANRLQKHSTRASANHAIVHLL